MSDMYAPVTCRMITIEMQEFWMVEPDPTRHIAGAKGRKWIDVATGEPPVPGDTFVYTRYKDFKEKLSDQYDRRGRDPICVVLPTGDWFVVDTKQPGIDDGWTITGEAPNLTLTPEINLLAWRGTLTDGVLTTSAPTPPLEPVAS